MPMVQGRLGERRANLLVKINHHFGDRGVYFEDPDGHLLEVITRPYSAELLDQENAAS